MDLSTNNTFEKVSIVKKVKNNNNASLVSYNSSNKDEKSLVENKKESLFKTLNVNNLSIGEDNDNSSEASYELEFEDVKF